MTTYDEYGVPVGAYSERGGLTTQAWRLARVLFVHRIRPTARAIAGACKMGRWRFKRLVTLVNALVVLWWAVLYWGERGVYNGAIEDCHWDWWEDWEADANPHRLVFIADPQLVDPHTYPNRPRPLKILTYKYTDLYLHRTYSRFQTILYPDTIFFLGDLFDGGREWEHDFWLSEYIRFGGIFFEHWRDGGTAPRPGQPGRKIIASLPGNHDLGFARGIQVGVRNRFSAFFGDSNRIDIIANHTFVSIDSVSLSALDQPNPNEVEALWRPTQSFLETAKTKKHLLIQRELRTQRGLSPHPGMQHKAIPLQHVARSQIPQANADNVTDFPTILLTHVPLYRPPGTPCGPHREHWPPTPPPPGQPPLENDDRNAIAVRGGYQYQNVLTRELSSSITEKIGDISYAFSGDDHDYCELLHRGYASAGGGIREVTVKSLSWAMGVRRPGIVLLSLWNPVDSEGRSKRDQGNGNGKTVQMKLCLLPDQLGIFIRYGILFGITLTLLVVRAALMAKGMRGLSAGNTNAPLLPTTSSAASAAAANLKLKDDTPASSSSTSDTPSSSSTSDRTPTGLHPRRGTTTFPSPYSLPNTPTYQLPLVQHATSPPSPSHTKDKPPTPYGVSTKVFKPRRQRRGASLFWYELRRSLGVVVCAAGAVYVWLVWRG